MSRKPRRDSQSRRTGSDDPRDNILAGTFYLRLMYDRFGYPALFAAYHSGPGRYSAYLAGRRGLPEATVAYLAAVAGKAPGKGSRPAMFAVRGRPGGSAPAGEPVLVSSGPLFVTLGDAAPWRHARTAP